MKFAVIEHGMSEEEFEFTVDGETVGRTTYDAHGSQGMRDMQNMFVAIAEKAGEAIEYKTC